METNRFIRVGAARGAMRNHRASAATLPGGRSVPPSAGFFCPVALLRFSSDAQASHFEARLATGQNHPGQIVPINLEPL